MEKADMNMKSQTLEKVVYKCQKRITASFLQIKIWTIQVLLSRPTFLNDSFECSCLIMEIYLTDKRETIDHIIKRPEIFHIEESRCKSIHLKITTGVTFIEATREQLVNFIFDQEAYENRDFLKICLNTMELVPLVRRIFEKNGDFKMSNLAKC
uniref:Uncharacterized protein n=1 Tax=Acrobeloides nanus TaxID=290746 RepID=A0A914CRV4_9BILA